MAADASQIGQELKAARERAGLSQKEAARLVQVEPISVSRWERGDRSPSALIRDTLLREYERITGGSAPEAEQEVSRGTNGIVAHGGPELPDAVWNREHEIEEELRKAGATPQQIRDFRRSVRESPLVISLFHGGAPRKLVTETEMNLYEHVAMGFAAIVRQMLREDQEAKRRQ